QAWQTMNRRRRPAPEPRRERLLEAARAYERLMEIHYLAADTPRLFHALLCTLNLAGAAGPCPELARAFASACVVAGLALMRPLARLYGGWARRLAAEIGRLSDRAWVLECTSLNA